jgi:exopolyphosphatase/guanosine-5'-triphosphate,3'-diphosphate pyrophosphatase
LICGVGESVEAFRSLEIGAVRLTERHLHSDPPTRTEYASACADAKARIAAFASCPDGTRAIGGVGGTAVNIAAVVHSSRDVHGKSVSREQLRETSERFLSVPLEERKAIPGLEPERADIILGGAAILEELMDRYRADFIRVSVRGMRYGLLTEMADDTRL